MGRAGGGGGGGCCWDSLDLIASSTWPDSWRDGPSFCIGELAVYFVHDVEVKMKMETRDTLTSPFSWYSERRVLVFPCFSWLARWSHGVYYQVFAVFVCLIIL
jgi:hypothetical protein